MFAWVVFALVLIGAARVLRVAWLLLARAIGWVGKAKRKG